MRAMATRIWRYAARTASRKRRVAQAMSGSTASAISASFQSRKSMMPIIPASTNPSSKIDTAPAVNISLSASTSVVTRVTTDVDALNEMFTAGAVSIFEDGFVLAGIIGIMLFLDWKLALIALAVLPLIAWATRLFRDAVRAAYRQIRVAIARINSYMQEHVTGIIVLQLFNREKRAYDEFTVTNKQHMDAFKDAIWAHAVYYPIVELLSTVAIALVFWFGGAQIMHSAVFRSVTWSHGFQLVTSVATIGILVATDV